MAKSKYYVVWNGRKPGIYTSWSACEAQVKGYAGAKFKSYPSKKEAEAAFRGEEATPKLAKEEIIWESLSVDVGSQGNPGIVEYKGVDTKTGEVLFEREPIPIGTNNMGEFLAIVHGLRYLKERNSSKPIYSDSQTAIKWVKDKKAKSTLVRNEETALIWKLVDEAEEWLNTHTYETPILKWQTDKWGEIKADYGRK